mgnify:CR=1 FL=1
MIRFSKYKRFIKYDTQEIVEEEKPIFGKCLSCNSLFVIEDDKQKYCLYHKNESSINMSS